MIFCSLLWLKVTLVVLAKWFDRFLPVVIFYFQAEDGIRDDLVTGVQTCALPLSNLKDIAGRPLTRLRYYFKVRALFSGL